MKKYDALHQALIQSYRQALKNRYTPVYVHRFKELSGLSPAKLEALYHYCSEYFYPDIANRTQRDRALEALGHILKSPHRLWHFMGVILHAFGKLGWQLAPALKIAFQTLETYLGSQELEKLMLERARKQKRKPKDLEKQEILEALVAKLPQKRVIRFQKKLLTLFRFLAQEQLIKEIISLLNKAQSVMKEKKYSCFEQEGLGYGIKMLEAGYALFRQLSATEVPLVIKGIELIENDWYTKILSKKT